MFKKGRVLQKKQRLMQCGSDKSPTEDRGRTMESNTPSTNVRATPSADSGEQRIDTAREVPLLAPRMLQVQSKPFDSGGESDVARVVVDFERAFSIFEIPKIVLMSTSRVFERAFVESSTSTNTTNQPTKEFFLPKVYANHFADFARWLRERQIISLPHSNVPYAIDSSARRLIDALALGILLESGGYQKAAMKEFFGLGHLLQWPEDYVNRIFWITASASSIGSHPARKMIVAMVAAKTIGSGKRKVRQGTRYEGVELDDRIAGDEFWVMLGAYVKTQTVFGECRYPESVDEFWTG